MPFHSFSVCSSFISLSFCSIWWTSNRRINKRQYLNSTLTEEYVGQLGRPSETLTVVRHLTTFQASTAWLPTSRRDGMSKTCSGNSGIYFQWTHRSLRSATRFHRHVFSSQVPIHLEDIQALPICMMSPSSSFTPQRLNGANTVVYKDLGGCR
ncbi:hypothetical protein C8Q75DRAFT_37813 [Abortiporus biennis]|nr:hypothetical protein C8Q75DRAFT_37813 [Abortiporus biennis]